MKLTVLAGDIGGTKTILRLVRAGTSGPGRAIPLLTDLFEKTYVSRSFADLVPMVHQFTSDAAESSVSAPSVDSACFGIAGPIVNNASELTNLSWSLSGERLQRALEIPRVTLINDFAAIGYGIAGLQDGQIATLQAATSDPAAPIAVIGAGTGLGEGFLIPGPGGDLRAFPSEGGHTDFAPRSGLEFQLSTYLLEKNSLPRVSVERVVSGTGIASIYQFFRDTNPGEESSAMAEIYRIWSREMGNREKTVDLAAEVSKAALAGRDFLCEQTMNLFISAYGAEAGNLALKVLPYGGLYLAGGIAPKILQLLQQGAFMKAFSSKGRMRPLLEKIPVRVILDHRVGLIGAALTAAREM
ncbi:MAG: glucokinase [Nitrospirae bacterium]|nr:glucokinase [Nitrospirota bacterium]